MSLQTQPIALSPARALETRGPITWRSLLLGLAGITFICGLTPYNDVLLNSAFIVGTYLPIGLLLFFIAFIILVNTPLRRLSPHAALTGGELTVALAMAMVSCGVASAGLMRYLPYALVALPYQSSMNADYREMLSAVNVPTWLLPTITGGAANGGNDPVIRNFVGRLPLEDPTVWSRLAAIPWRAWATPTLTWGIFLAALYTALLCMTVIVRQQWAMNERLAFPLASVYASLVETPEPGHSLNALLGSRLFWITTLAVMGIYLVRGLSLYFPRTVPTIPLEYNFSSIFSEPPLSYMGYFFKFGRVYFCMIGIAYFLQSKIGFSLWFSMVALQVVLMITGEQKIEITGGAQTDEIFGGGMVYVAILLWIGRHHWRNVLCRMFARPTRGPIDDRYLPLGVAGWGLVACAAVMAIWFFAAGATLVGAIVITIVVLLMFLIIARVVAETGLVFVQTGMISPARLWDYGAGWFGPAAQTTNRTYFLAALFQGTVVHDLREAPSVYASHAVKIADDTAFAEKPGRWRPTAFLGILLLSMLLAVAISGVATLYINYSYAATLDTRQASPLNDGSLSMFPKNMTLEPLRRYMNQSGDSHSRITHLSIGAVLTGILSMLRLRFAGWPLHPIGFLLVYSFAMSISWLSIFVGWVAKVTLVRFGGVSLFRQARPVFLGLIIGEAAGAALWLLVNVTLSWMNIPYKLVQVVPY